MQEHEQRVVDERNELAEKHRKLGQFLEGDIYADLPYEDRKLLTIQHSIMGAYAETLNARIGRFK